MGRPPGRSALSDPVWRTQSDNGAANALLRRLGGPAGFTQWLREQSDALTRVDRYEPEMNRVRPGEARADPAAGAEVGPGMAQSPTGCRSPA